MNTEEILRFIQDNRVTAQAQAQRWEGVDPSRLLQALDYLEGLIKQEPQAATAATRVLADTALLRDTIELYAHSLELTPTDPWRQGVEVAIELVGTLDTPAAERVVDAFQANTKIRIVC